PETRAIGLQEADAAGLQVILEDDAVGNMFAESKRERSDLRSQLFVGEDVIGMRGLFDPVGIDASEFLACDDGSRQGPLLICVEHDGCAGSHNLSQALRALQIALQRASHFQLEGSESLI